MIELATLARPYSEAIFKRAKETGSTDEWSAMLAFVSSVMDHEQLSSAASNPRIEQGGFTRLLLDICEGQLNEEGKNLVRLLIENNRLSLVRYIHHLFEELKAEEEGYVDVNVKTAFPLSDQDQQQLSKSLEISLDKKVKLHSDVDAGLIGGVLIRAGDKVIDGTVRGQLQQLSQRLGT